MLKIEEAMHVEAEGIREISVPSAHFGYEPKNSLKNGVYFKNKNVAFPSIIGNKS